MAFPQRHEEAADHDEAAVDELVGREEAVDDRVGDASEPVPEVLRHGARGAVDDAGPGEDVQRGQPFGSLFPRLITITGAPYFSALPVPALLERPANRFGDTRAHAKTLSLPLLSHIPDDALRLLRNLPDILNVAQVNAVRTVRPVDPDQLRILHRDLSHYRSLSEVPCNRRDNRTNDCTDNGGNQWDLKKEGKDHHADEDNWRPRPPVSKHFPPCTEIVLHPQSFLVGSGWTHQNTRSVAPHMNHHASGGLLRQPIVARYRGSRCAEPPPNTDVRLVKGALKVGCEKPAPFPGMK